MPNDAESALARFVETFEPERGRGALVVRSVSAKQRPRRRAAG